MLGRARTWCNDSKRAVHGCLYKIWQMNWKNVFLGCVRTGIANFNSLLSDNFEISSYTEDKHFI